MRFNTTIIPFVGNDSWVETALIGAKKTLEEANCPRHSDGCEHGKFLEQVSAELMIGPEVGGNIICEYGPAPEED